MSTSTQLPETIRASIHPDAINQVPAFFNATTLDILNELFQNARRSGATAVEVTTEPATMPGDEMITVTDNGGGIADPATLLAFGQTGWNDSISQAERAAGMGLYALARSERVTVRSKQQGGPAWKVDLTPEHFVGNLSAPIETVEDQDAPPGTAVTFLSRSNEYRATEYATEYYPLPVWLNGDPLEREDFLELAIHTELWQGIRIGVYNNYHSPKALNFHGITVLEPNLPVIYGINTKWSTRVDVVDSHQLELTLPARKAVIETPFMQDLREACRKAIFTAMTLQLQPVDVPKEVQTEAAASGIHLPDASPQLKPWHPQNARSEPTGGNRDPRPIDPHTLVLDLNLDPPDQQGLARAATLNSISSRLMRANARLDGYRWYDQLPKAKQLTIALTYGDDEWDLKTLRDEGETFEGHRPDSVVYTLHITEPDGETSTIQLPSDIAFENKGEDYINEARPIVTKDTNMQAPQLAALLLDAYFSPNIDDDEDSYDTQRQYHENDYDRTALDTLNSPEDAVRTYLLSAVRRHLQVLVPANVVATIRISQAEPVRIDIEILPEPEQEDTGEQPDLR